MHPDKGSMGTRLSCSHSLPSGERGSGSSRDSCLARGVETGEGERWKQGDSRRARLMDIPESSESWLTSVEMKSHYNTGNCKYCIVPSKYTSPYKYPPPIFNFDDPMVRWGSLCT